MSSTLREVAVELGKSNKKVQLIYAFNGTGKTRLSREFKELIAPKTEDGNGEDQELARNKILYYNAFTEDLFYWNNDLENDVEPTLQIQPNTFTDWILKDQGKDRDIITTFQRYTNDKLNPHFSADFSEVSFSLDRGDATSSGKIKISKGEESNFVWSVFYSLLEEVFDNIEGFEELEYVFIDDPVSSLDENHLIELAMNLAGLISSHKGDLKFIITTHNPLFYNVLYKELNSACYMLKRLEDGSFVLDPKKGAANQSFSYHLHLKAALEEAISNNQVEKSHFNMLRNLYEKTAGFLGYSHWTDLLSTAPDGKADYLKKLANHYSHRELAYEEIAEPTTAQKQDVEILLQNLVTNYGYLQQENEHA